MDCLMATQDTTTREYNFSQLVLVVLPIRSARYKIWVNY
ncbi:MAG: hypothetical protein MRERV_30c019 [Mycoplasmataceae bacterium RV_VA103A]|nr:MAG: hypothetical protein MRERV_30c019 [Mycoplasmataceae bacterium RV_VA103A]